MNILFGELTIKCCNDQEPNDRFDLINEDWWLKKIIIKWAQQMADYPSQITKKRYKSRWTNKWYTWIGNYCPESGQCMCEKLFQLDYLS